MVRYCDLPRFAAPSIGHQQTTGLYSDRLVTARRSLWRLTMRSVLSTPISSLMHFSDSECHEGIRRPRDRFYITKLESRAMFPSLIFCAISASRSLLSV